MRSAVYRGATFAQRRTVQQALAAALSGVDDVDRRTWHLAAASFGPDETVAEALHRSAETARSRGAHTTAAAAYERAAELTPDAEVRAQRLAAGARAAWLGGQPDRARILLTQAGQLSQQPGLRAEVEHLRGSIEFSCGTPASGYAILVAGSEPIAATDPGKAARMLPAAKAGVGSAMNDTVRQIGGALGVAVLGSILSAEYGRRMASAASALPGSLAALAGNSVEAAHTVAGRLGPAGRALTAAADTAFTDAMSLTVLVAAAIAVAGGVVAALFLPARETSQPQPSTAQQAAPADRLDAAA